MARGFGATLGSGASDAVATTLSANPAVMSFHAWVNWHATGGGTFGRVFDATGGGANNGMWCWSNGPTNYSFNAGFTSNGQWLTDTAPTADTWQSLGVKFDSGNTTNDPTVYQNGTKKTVGSGLTENLTPSGTYNAGGAVIIGNRSDGLRNWDGMIAEFAMWNVLLDDAEFAALSKGYSPFLIRTGSLVEYVPLVRANVSRKLAAPTITGTAVQPHPRIIMPRPKQISYHISPLLRQVHYRFRTDGNAADAAPTWGAAEDAGGYDPGASNFRLRVSVANTGAAVGAQPFELYLSKNSGAYAPITTTSTGGVKSADASTDADETAIKVPRLTPGT